MVGYSEGLLKGETTSNQRATRHTPLRTCGAVWSARRPVKAEVAGSNPVRSAARSERQQDNRIWSPGRVAQLVERAPEKREVRGSIPRPTTGDVLRPRLNVGSMRRSSTRVSPRGFPADQTRMNRTSAIASSPRS